MITERVEALGEAQSAAAIADAQENAQRPGRLEGVARFIKGKFVATAGGLLSEPCSGHNLRLEIAASAEQLSQIRRLCRGGNVNRAYLPSQTRGGHDVLDL